MGRRSALHTYVTKVACAMSIAAGYDSLSLSMPLLLVLDASGTCTEARHELSCSNMGCAVWMESDRFSDSFCDAFNELQGSQIVAL